MTHEPKPCPICGYPLFPDVIEHKRHDCRQLNLRQVWDILVQECGAIADPMSGHGYYSFCAYFGDPTASMPKEFRFMGNLGFGGKVWLERPLTGKSPVSVNYYSEHRTPERDEMERRTNERLAELFAR